MSFRRAAWFWLGVCATLIASTAAHANDVRYVGFGGDDANPCTRLAPCLTLQRGLDATPAGGEVQILTAGEYAPATITKSITISAEGVSATTQGFKIDGVDVVVTLRGLLIDGAATGPDFRIGVDVRSAKAVHIVRCEIKQFRFYGIRHAKIGDQATGDLYLVDTIIRDISNGTGIYARVTKGSVIIDNSRLLSNSEALNIGVADVSITRSLLSGNRGAGQIRGARVHIGSTTSTSNGTGYSFRGGRLTLESSSAAHNSVGIVVGNRSTRMSNATITDNLVGIRNDTTALTRRNSTISGNKTDLVGNPLIPIRGQ
jgi:hypothetical protein